MLMTSKRLYLFGFFVPKRDFGVKYINKGEKDGNLVGVYCPL